MLETRVVNAHEAKYDQLIDRTTIFGNPFPVEKWGREGCIRRFQTYFYKRLERDPAWRDEVLKLKGKILGCHCKPLSCHGDIYADYLNSYDEIERYRITPALKKILEDVDRLATEHGWYPPELQGYVLDKISEIDSLAMRQIAARADNAQDRNDIDAIQDVYDYLHPKQESYPEGLQ